MRQNGFVDPDWELGTIGDVVRALSRKAVITSDDERTIGDAIATFKEHGISQLPCTHEGRLSGIVTESDLLRFLVAGRSEATPLAEVMVRRVATVTMDESAGELPSIFERGEVALVVDGERQVQALVTKMDLIDFLAARARLGGFAKGA
jgi:cystathionine beta-synthase